MTTADGGEEGEAEMEKKGVDPVDPEGRGELRGSGELGVCAGVPGREECFMAERRGCTGIGM